MDPEHWQKNGEYAERNFLLQQCPMKLKGQYFKKIKWGIINCPNKNKNNIFRAWKPFFCFLGVKILKLFDEDPGSGMETVRILDGKKSDPGSGINIPDPQHWREGFLLVNKHVELLLVRCGKHTIHSATVSGKGNIINRRWRPN